MPKSVAMKPSPFAPKKYPPMPAIAGCELAVTEAGIKYKDRADVLLARFAPGTTVAGTFTKSKTASGAVEWCREHVQAGQAEALIVNSGNANAFTGQRGEKNVQEVGKQVAELIGGSPSKVFQASTGVIGEPLPEKQLQDGIKACFDKLGSSGYADAAKAIMTTDTYPKFTTQSGTIEDTTITLNGIAKGSGMIAPDMATMLAFLVTDLVIAPDVLQALLSKSVNKTFNCVTVDGDTSTSDTVLIFATNQAKMAPITDVKDPRLSTFRRILNRVMKDLALMIVKDGEGISKFVTIKVHGAKGKRAAKKIGLSIANSPLVKTAIAGEDPNWGRIIMAVGKSGEAADRDKLNIKIGGHQVTEQGERIQNYDETLDNEAWFGNMKDLAEKHGFAKNGKLYKKDPESYNGTIADAAKILRVALTGKAQTPDLYSLMHVMGKDRVLKRLEQSTEISERLSA